MLFFSLTFSKDNYFLNLLKLKLPFKAARTLVISIRAQVCFLDLLISQVCDLLASAKLIAHLPIEFPNNICWCAWLTFGYWVYVYSRKLGKGKRQLLWILNRRGAFLPFFHLVLPRLVFSSEIATAQAAGCPGLCCKSANNKISEKKVWGWHFRGRSNLELVRFWRFYNLFL